MGEFDLRVSNQNSAILGWLFHTGISLIWNEALSGVNDTSRLLIIRWLFDIFGSTRLTLDVPTLRCICESNIKYGSPVIGSDLYLVIGVYSTFFV